jgi:8-oxo-dGTP pyrophosphatase MutT (NUDIX family)
VKNKKKIVYNYNPFITVYKENFKNKHQSRKNFHKIKLQNAAMVILKNEKNQILFLNEYRRGIKKKSLGFPGGHIEIGENPIETVKRELLEETGYKGKNWKLLFKYTRHGTYHCGQDFVFTAKIGDSLINEKKNENLQKKWLNKKEILALLNNNKFETAGIIASVSFYFIKNRYNVKNKQKLKII